MHVLALPLALPLHPLVSAFATMRLAALAGGAAALRWAWGRQALHWISAHTGVPVLVVAAVLIVLSYRLAKQSLRFALEVSLVLAVLAVLAKLGILRF